MHPQFQHSKFQKLLEIVAQLRAEGGCPWDRKQTIGSLLPKLIEEAQEVKEAVEKKDSENLEEELGDVLLNILMISEIAQEDGKFTIDSILEKITKKVVSRHTWVFGTDKAETAEEALAIWAKNKRSEKTTVQADLTENKEST